MKLLLALDLQRNAESLLELTIPWLAVLRATVDLATVVPRASDADRKALNAHLARIPEASRGVARVEAGDHIPGALGKLAEGYDAMIIGAKPDPDRTSFWLGTVTEQLVRFCPRSVLVVRTPPRVGSPPKMLFAVDPNEDASVFPAVGRWAGAFGGTVDLLTVDELSSTHRVENATWDSMLEQAAHAYERERTQRLSEVRDQFLPEAARGKVVVRRGGAAAVILEHAERYDLVGVGTHERGVLTRALLGSVAERVVRGAACSVLVVRP